MRNIDVRIYTCGVDLRPENTQLECPSTNKEVLSWGSGNLSRMHLRLFEMKCSVLPSALSFNNIKKGSLVSIRPTCGQGFYHILVVRVGKGD